MFFHGFPVALAKHSLLLHWYLALDDFGFKHRHSTKTIYIVLHTSRLHDMRGIFGGLSVRCLYVWKTRLCSSYHCSFFYRTLSITSYFCSVKAAYNYW